MEDLIAACLERVPDVLDAVSKQLPPEFPQEMFEAIAQGMRESARRLEAMPATLG